MGELSALHAQATRLILALREGMERLEAIEVGSFRTGAPGAPAAAPGLHAAAPVHDAQALAPQLPPRDPAPRP
jgi:hypothetical protein